MFLLPRIRSTAHQIAVPPVRLHEFPSSLRHDAKIGYRAAREGWLMAKGETSDGSA